MINQLISEICKEPELCEIYNRTTNFLYDRFGIKSAELCLFATVAIKEELIKRGCYPCQENAASQEK